MSINHFLTQTESLGYVYTNTIDNSLEIKTPLITYEPSLIFDLSASTLDNVTDTLSIGLNTPVLALGGAGNIITFAGTLDFSGSLALDLGGLYINSLGPVLSSGSGAGTINAYNFVGPIKQSDPAGGGSLAMDHVFYTENPIDYKSPITIKANKIAFRNMSPQSNPNSMYGLDVEIIQDTSVTAIAPENYRALQSTATINGHGNIGTVISHLNTIVIGSGSSTTSLSHCSYNTLQNSFASSLITEWRGVYAGVVANGGTITTATGLYIDRIRVGGTVTNAFGIQQVERNIKNIFNSPLTFDAIYTPIGTTGNQTINAASGTVNFALGSATLKVTNSYCVPTSMVFAVLQTNDANALIKNVVPSNGSFNINLQIPTAGVTTCAFIIYNS